MLAEPAPSASVVIPVKDGARWLGEVLAAVSRRNWVLRSWSSTRARATTPWTSLAPPGFRSSRSSRRPSATGAPATWARSAQRRAGLLPDPGRHARAGMSGRASRGPRALRSRRRGLRAAPAAARDLADDRPRADRVLRRFPDSLDDSASSPTPTPATSAPAGRRSASTMSPTRRTRRSLEPCAPPATGWEKAYNRAPACCTPTTTRRSPSCAATSTSTAACASQRRSSARVQYLPRVGPLMMQNSGPTGRPRRNSSQGWSSPQPHASMPTSRPSALAAPDQERAAALIEIGFRQCQRFLDAQSGPP
jgi:hypothetical protein